jgi:hypothetical protein
MEQLQGNKTITITAASGQKIGYLDTAGALDGAATIEKGKTLYVHGWTADTVAGAPVQTVTVLIDGSNVGMGGSVLFPYARSNP